MPSHDVMPDIELYQPVQGEDARDLASRLAERGWLLGGGQDTYGWLKDRNKSPEAMISSARAISRCISRSSSKNGIKPRT